MSQDVGSYGPCYCGSISELYRPCWPCCFEEEFIQLQLDDWLEEDLSWMTTR